MPDTPAIEPEPGAAPEAQPAAPTRPLVQRTAPAEAQSAEAAAAPLKILIADDHAPLRLALREVLETHFAGCEVLEAATAEEATTLAELHAPAIVVMDLRIPVMNGIAATRLIKKAQPQTRVVMFSQHEDEAYQAQAGAAGASGYIYKREITQVLVPLVTELLRNKD